MESGLGHLCAGDVADGALADEFFRWRDSRRETPPAKHVFARLKRGDHVAPVETISRADEHPVYAGSRTKRR